MKFIWKGPPTVVEVWPEPSPGAVDGAGSGPLFSGPVSTGAVIDADLPEAHPQVISWRAFKLIEPSQDAAPVQLTKPRKEPANG